MLRKLYKHEFGSLFRTLSPIYLAVIVIALVTRFSFLMRSDNTVINILQVLSVTLYVLADCAVFIAGMILVIGRFYKSMLSREGYLTFTLPFKPSQLINCKLICGVVVTIINMLVVIASLVLLGLGTDVLSEVFSVIGECFGYMNEEFGAGRVIGIVVEAIAFLIIGIFTSYLMFFVSMSIGQNFKNRVAGSVISYICLYIIMEIVAFSIYTPTAVKMFDEDLMTNEIEILNKSQGYIGIILGVEIIIGIVYYCVTRYMLTKKLNLE